MLSTSAFLRTLAALAGVGMLLAPTAQAQSPCPALSFKTMKASVKNGVVTVAVNVQNVGNADLDNVGLRVTVPFSVEYKKATVIPAIRNGDRLPRFIAPNIFWPSFSLPRGKGRTFKLRGKISSCQESGQFPIVAAVNIADCITEVEAGQVSVVAKATKSGWRPDCPTPAPTPTGAAAPFAVYGADQRCLEAQPLSSVRMLADRSLALEPPGTPEGCYEACYAKGLTPEFYFEVRDGECYCCQTCTPVYSQGTTTYAGLTAPPEPTPAPYYTKAEIDALLSTKADASDVYNKTETDALLSFKLVDASSHVYSSSSAAIADSVLMEPNTVYNVEIPSSYSNMYIQMLCPATGVFVAYLTAASTNAFYIYPVSPDGEDSGYLYSYGMESGGYGTMATYICVNGLQAISYIYV